MVDGLQMPVRLSWKRFETIEVCMFLSSGYPTYPTLPTLPIFNMPENATVKPQILLLHYFIAVPYIRIPCRFMLTSLDPSLFMSM